MGSCLGLKSLRKSRGLTQAELASHIGVSYGAIGMWETGKREPDNSTLICLADFFGVTTDEILGLNPNRYEDEPAQTEKNPAPQISEADADFVAKFNSLGEDDRKLVENMVDHFSSKGSQHNP